MSIIAVDYGTIGGGAWTCNMFDITYAELTGGKTFDCGIDNPDIIIGLDSRGDWRYIYYSANISNSSTPTAESRQFRMQGSGSDAAATTISGSLVTISNFFTVNAPSYRMFIAKKNS